MRSFWMAIPPIVVYVSWHGGNVNALGEKTIRIGGPDHRGLEKVMLKSQDGLAVTRIAFIMVANKC